MTALDWYYAFAFGFLIFALWVMREASAARKRLREKEERDQARDERSVPCPDDEGGWLQ